MIVPRLGGENGGEQRDHAGRTLTTCIMPACM
jgi:hypothetical protein